MRYLCLIVLSAVLVLLLPLAIGDELTQLQQAEEKLTQSAPALIALREAHPDNLEIQLGTASLLRALQLPAITTRQQYERILALDPDNGPANVVLAKMQTDAYIGARTLITRLENMIDNSRSRGLTEQNLKTSSRLHEYLKDYVRVVESPAIGPKHPTKHLIDFDLAQKVLREKIDSDALPVLKILDERQGRDPDNAFYAYLKAAIHLQLGDTDAALAAMAQASAKKHVTQYVPQIERAESTVLDEIAFPENLRKYVSGKRATFAGYIRDYIWQKGSSTTAPPKGLSQLAAEYETQGDFEAAKSIYNLIIKADQQCAPEEYMPAPLAEVAENRIAVLSAKASPYRHPSAALYLSIAISALLASILCLTLYKKRRELAR